jgi:homospermidine synthase
VFCFCGMAGAARNKKSIMTTTYEKHARLSGPVVMLGFGSIGQAVLPLLQRHLELPDQPITIFAADANGAEIARELGARMVVEALTIDNYCKLLEPLLVPGALLLNLSVGISSKALIELCQEVGALYLDMCLEPWPGGYVDPTRPPAKRSNYALREDVLSLRQTYPTGPTAILTMGANPGLANIFVKQGLMRIAVENGLEPPPRGKPVDWGSLARQLDIKAIHIAERDTQVTGRRKQRGEFVNTWSVAGFIGEALQPAELGWGTHERHWPADASRHGNGCDSSIFLNRPGAATKVRSWTPLEGPYHGFLITHGESISISDHLTVWEDGEVAYRPTVQYAYHPCDDAVLSLHELAGSNWSPQRTRRIIRDEITCGMDELGVLLMGNRKGAYWFGSRLTIAQARALVPYNNATSLQVAAGVLAGAVWAAQHPHSGIIEPDDLDCDDVMQIARPYLGDVVGVYTDWTPLEDRGYLFTEDLDTDDPWQFKNIRVN